PTPQPVLDATEDAFTALSSAGATVVDLDAAGFKFASADGEFLVLLFVFRNDGQAYFATRTGVPVAGGTLQSAIAFNNAHVAGAVRHGVWRPTGHQLLRHRLQRAKADHARIGLRSGDTGARQKPAHVLDGALQQHPG